MKLSDEQKWWLNRNGGRSEKDVFIDDEENLYVEMYKPPTNIDPLNYEKVYVPKS